MLKLITFIVVSAGIVVLSWRSLRELRSHGFSRFFAFEAILVLILLNAEYWFREPFSTLQIISWLLLMMSLIMAIFGFYLLRKYGRPKEGFDNTTVLVNCGIYRFIRHPLYGSLLLLGWGVFLKDTSFGAAASVLVASAFLVATAKAEEKENLRKFGDNYATYMKTTKMFIPFIV